MNLKPGETDARKILATLAAAVSGGIFSNWLSHRFGGEFKPAGARSTRGAAEIIGELRAFYSQRPRPWRAHQHIRSARRGPVYDKWHKANVR